MAGVGTVMVGSNDIEKAKAFYDALLGVLGMGTAFEHPSGGRIYAGGSGAMFAVVRPFDGGDARPGNGTMTSFGCDSREQVDAFHAKALALGAKDEGAPGPRGGDDSPVYAAYARDLDGNKLSALHFRQG